MVVFHALDEKHIAGIAKIQLGYLEKRLAQLEMGIDVEDSALAELAMAGFDPVFGARPLKRASNAASSSLAIHRPRWGHFPTVPR